MRVNGVWGTHTEVIAWAYLHRRVVRVFSWNFNTHELYNVAINPFDMPGAEPAGPGDEEEEVRLLLLYDHYYHLRVLQDGEEPPVAVDGARNRSSATLSALPTTSSASEGGGEGGEESRGGQASQQTGSERNRWRDDPYGGRSRSHYTFNNYTARHSSTSIGGPPRPIRTLDEKALYTCMFAVFGTDWRAMVQAWRSKIIEQVRDREG